MISIAIPCYEYHGKGAEVLERTLKSILLQTFKDYEVVIADHSLDDKVETLCKKWVDRFELRYFRNNEYLESPAQNTEYAIKRSKGDLIKILCQDDYFFDQYSLEKTVYGFNEGFNWLASAYLHTYNHLDFFKYHLPQLNSCLYLENTVGTPSCVTIKNVDPMPSFDYNLNYSYDGDFYQRFIEKYGNPKIITDVTIVNLLWEKSLTSFIQNREKDRENDYLKKKYKKK